MELPCIDCITLAMCRQVQRTSRSGGMLVLMDKCSLLNDYILIKDLRPMLDMTTPKNEIELISTIQTDRMVNVIKYMGFINHYPQFKEGEK